jgi:hypothetical protein
MPEPIHSPSSSHFTAFADGRQIAAGPLRSVVTTAHASIKASPASSQILIFRDATGEQVDVDLQGPLKRILSYLPEFSPLPTESADSSHVPEPVGPGRPKLGVIPREVTLLPRHWEWLGTQPGGASVTLRKLVEEARRTSQHQDTLRRSREAGYRFMVATAGNLQGFEKASRALFAGQRSGFEKAIASWPVDLRTYTLTLTASAWS